MRRRRAALWTVAVGVVLAASALWFQNWWTFTAMAILVGTQLVELVRIRRAGRARLDADGETSNATAGTVTNGAA